MTTATKKRHSHSPKPGMIIEPVITYEKLPIVTQRAREELLSSLQKGEEDMKNGSGQLLSASELKAAMRKRFEETTGFKVS